MQLNLKRNYGYPLLQCENLHPPHTSLFPDYLFQGMSAYSLEPGKREAIFHSLKHSFDFSFTVSKIFPLWVFPLLPHVTVSFLTKLQRAEKP